ncbi:MAG: M20/M25/M40 family metallo-hydrolase [Phycisphaerales bacterium]
MTLLTAATLLALALHAPAAPPTAQEVMALISPDSCKALDEKLVSFGTRHTLSDTTSETRGVGAARRWIKQELESYIKASGGRLRVSLEEFEAPRGPRIPQPTPVANVVAILPGGMPEAAARRYYVVGHYDSMPSNVNDPNSDAPGANDDASGTVVVMEIARVLSQLPPTDATIVFLCTVGEEQGLVGAKYHADSAATRKEDIRAVLSNDIVGDPWGPGGDKTKTTKDRIRIFSEPFPRNAPAQELARIRNLGAENDSPSRALARYIAEVAEKEKTAIRPMIIYRQDRFLRGGDHSAFNEAGFAAVRFTEVHEDYRHQHQTPRTEVGPDGTEIKYGDLPEHVDFPYLADVTRLNAAAIVHLANAPSTPKNARIITARLEYTTTLRWDKSPEPDTAGYEIVWRETTSPVWQHVKDVGDAAEATIDESKDNVFFGVRAYDKDGYRSPVAFPNASRE